MKRKVSLILKISRTNSIDESVEEVGLTERVRNIAKESPDYIATSLFDEFYYGYGLLTLDYKQVGEHESCTESLTRDYTRL